MRWTVELESEVARWLLSLQADDFGQAMFYVDLLEAEGIGLGFPYSSQLDGKLRELRFRIGRTRWRITYYAAIGRRFVLLTVFAKTARHERAEIARANSMMLRCIDEGHTAEDEGGT